MFFCLNRARELLALFPELNSLLQNMPFVPVAGFLGYPQPGGGAHPPIPRGGELGDRLGDWADLALRQAHKNTMI